MERTIQRRKTLQKVGKKVANRYKKNLAKIDSDIKKLQVKINKMNKLTQELLKAERDLATVGDDAQLTGGKVATIGDDAQRGVGKLQTIGDDAQLTGDKLQTIGDDAQLTGDKLATIGDDAQLGNIDLQNALQTMQQTLQTLRNVQKMAHDSAMTIIRKIS